MMCSRDKTVMNRKITITVAVSPMKMLRRVIKKKMMKMTKSMMNMKMIRIMMK